MLRETDGVRSRGDAACGLTSDPLGAPQKESPSAEHRRLLPAAIATLHASLQEAVCTRPALADGESILLGARPADALPVIIRRAIGLA